CVDLSIGTPCDAPPQAVLDALAGSGAERGYPPSIGTKAFRDSAADWLQRRFGATVDSEAQVAACIGTKEFVASTPRYLKLRSPDRDTVLYPAVSYPSYAMGAELAGCRAVPVPVDSQWRIRVDAITPEDAERALCLWVNSPGNPAGGVDDLAVVARWGRDHDVPVFSDECYIEFTWADLDGNREGHPGRTILETGTDGVVAVHSLSKRSNLAGVRAGFFAGDDELVHWLREVRKHAGNMTPGPVQAAAVVALGDDAHVDRQREVYAGRLEFMAEALRRAGLDAHLPHGAFYLWVAAADGDAWHTAERLANEGGVLVSPGEFYGDAGARHVRLAMVQPEDRLKLVADRLGVL
ncbi:MAG: aminotransferase class I/II-fold pyridoxal phosphate-dependent enzyme, partial [Acidimicrobiales bacterium]